MRLQSYVQLWLTAIFAFAFTIAKSQAPSITSFNPTSGPVGTVVTITGTNLSNPTSVSIGSVAAIVVSSSATEIKAMVRSGSLSGSISVTNNSISATSASNFAVTVLPSIFANSSNNLRHIMDYFGGANFASAIALSADGNTIVFDNQGIVFVYEKSGNNWIKQSEIVTQAHNTTRDNSLAISANGTTIVYGTPGIDNGNGGAWIIVKSGQSWVLEGAKLIGFPSTGRGYMFRGARSGVFSSTVGAGQGASVAISADGNTVAIGGPGEGSYGATWVFTRSGNSWSQQGNKLVGTGSILDNSSGYYWYIPSINQGASISLSGDGNTLVVGGSADSTYKGAAWIFVRNGNIWSQQGPKLVPNNALPYHFIGTSVSISAEGNTVAVGGNGDNFYEGASWVFQRSAGVWIQDGPIIKGTNSVGASRQGSSVSLSADGQTLLVGGPADNSNKGALWYFRKNTGSWLQVGNKITGVGVPDSSFLGETVFLTGDGSNFVANAPQDRYKETTRGKSVWAWGSTLPAGQSARLTDLIVVDTIITPNFNPLDLRYALTLPLSSSKSSIIIKPTSEEPNALIQIKNNTDLNWNVVGSGSNSPAINLQQGYNLVTVRVTSLDRSVIWDYTILVNRLAGNVSSGGSGGLESKSLGDAVVKRVYQNAKTNQNVSGDYSKMEEVKYNNNIRSLSNGSNSNMTLGVLMPDIPKSGMVAYYSSPSDLVSFTNAKEVLSVDFTLEKECKAVAFATKTKGFIYDHNKQVCDRLKGASIIDLQKFQVYGIDFIRYYLINEKGQREYATSFSVGTQSGRGDITIQSKWLSKEYIGEETMFNFQLWAANTELLDSLVFSVLDKMSSFGVVKEISKPIIPRSFILSGRREGSKLNLKMTNADALKNGYFTFEDKLNESSIGTNKRNIPFTLNAKGETTISIPISDTYESTISMFVEGELKDVIYMTDGTWYVDYNQATSSISSFVVSNDANRILADNELPIFRNVSIKAKSPDFITVVKTLKGGGIETNLSDYKGLKFTGAGGQNLRITLVKNSVANWDNQYSIRLKLDQEKKDYFVAFDKFKSKSTTSSIKPDDITAVLFTFEVENSINTNLSNELSQLSFTKADLSYLSSFDDKEINIFPNPASNKFYATFKSPKEVKLNLIVRDAASGRVVFSKWINATKGENTVPVEIQNSVGLSNFILNIEGSDIKYQSKKVIISQ